MPVDVEKICEQERDRAESLEAFKQDVWDYAQAHYNVSAPRLNSWDEDIEKAFESGTRDAIEYVDAKFWGI
jgi:hypothetical protein